MLPLRELLLSIIDIYININRFTSIINQINCSKRGI